MRISYYKNPTGSAEVLEENNYYPFGLKHSGYNNIRGANPSYQYKYNGKELQESGMYDYGARFYMPDIGRWGVVDPLAEKSTRWSPYTYAFNNPIRFIDPDGREGTDWYKDKKGDYVYDASLNASNASTKLASNEKYLGESATINVNNKNGEQVGQIDLKEDGGIKVSEDFASDGHVKYNDIGTEKGNVEVVDAGLSSGAKIYGVDTFSYSNKFENNDSNPFNNSKFEYNSKAIATNAPNYIPQKLPFTDTVVGKIATANAGTGIDRSYCSECPRPEAGPGPSNPGYNSFNLGVAIMHLLYHNDNNKEKKDDKK